MHIFVTYVGIVFFFNHANSMHNVSMFPNITI